MRHAAARGPRRSQGAAPGRGRRGGQGAAALARRAQDRREHGAARHLRRTRGRRPLAPVRAPRGRRSCPGSSAALPRAGPAGAPGRDPSGLARGQRAARAGPHAPTPRGQSLRHAPAPALVCPLRLSESTVTGATLTAVRGRGRDGRPGPRGPRRHGPGVVSAAPWRSAGRELRPAPSDTFPGCPAATRPWGPASCHNAHRRARTDGVQAHVHGCRQASGRLAPPLRGRDLGDRARRPNAARPWREAAQ